MNVRPLTEADFPAVAALIEEDERALGRPGLVGVNEVREWTSRSELARDSWLYEDADGPAAVCWVSVHEDLGVGIGVVHPRAKGLGLGAELAERSERELRSRGVGRVHQFALGTDRAAAELFRRRGYREARRFYEMAIRLDAAPDVPVEPSVEVFREEDARAFHAALDEAFQDHWEHHSTPADQWFERHRSNPNFDPTLWFLVRDGGEIAAVARTEANRNGGGYVGALGVRRPWRGRGFGRALLLHAFGEFHRRGIARVTLGVDAENPTGATRLYERVGMHVETENVVYEMTLA